MRKFLIFTLTILLGFQPAVLAAPPVRSTNENIKSLIETSGVAEKSQTLGELYQRVSPILTPAQRYELKRMVDLHGSEKLPKFAVRKIKAANGKEVYQLQGQSNGAAVTLELAGESASVMKINGQNFTASDFNSTEHLMTKVGIPTEVAKGLFPRAPASVTPQYLTALQIAKLPKEEQRKYFKQLRELFESMEAVQNAVPARKVIMNEVPASGNKFAVISRWLQGEPAFAALAEGEECVAGGHFTVVVNDPHRVDPATGQKRPGLTCGSDGRGGVRSELRGNCGVNEFSCNETLFGKSAGCAPAGTNTTADCHARVIRDKIDIPNIAKDANDFQNLLDAARSQADELRRVCAGITGRGPTVPSGPANPRRGKIGGGTSADATEPSADRAPASSGGGKPRPTRPPSGPNALDQDQIKTCNDLEKRFEEMNKWNCSDANFAAANPNACKPATPQIPPTPVTMPGPTLPPLPPEQKIPNCRDLRPPQTTSTKCSEQKKVGKEKLENAYGWAEPVTGGTREKDAAIDCLDESGKPQPIFVCKCDSEVGRWDAGKNLCVSNGKGDTDKDDKKDKKKTDWKKYAFWGGMGVIGLGAIALFANATKKALKQQYDYMNPKEQNPPLAPPTSNDPVSPTTGNTTTNPSKVAPTPRGTGTSK